MPSSGGSQVMKTQGIEAEEDDLEDAVEGDQTCANIRRCPWGQLVPHEDHGDAAGDAHKNEPDHVFPGGCAKRERRGMNMSTGPTIQFCTEREREHLHIGEETFGASAHYFTFARGGYIMRMSPAAIQEV